MVNQVAFLDSKPQGNQQQGNNFNQAYNSVNNASNGQQNNNALNYINPPLNAQNGQYSQQQMQMSGTGGINNTNNLFSDFGNNYNLDDVLNNVVNPFTES